MVDKTEELSKEGTPDLLRDHLLSAYARIQALNEIASHIAVEISLVSDEIGKLKLYLKELGE